MKLYNFCVHSSKSFHLRGQIPYNAIQYTSFSNFTQTIFILFFSAKLRAFKFNPKQYKRNINTFETLRRCYEFITGFAIIVLPNLIQIKRENC